MSGQRHESEARRVKRTTARARTLAPWWRAPCPFIWRRRENSLHFISLMNERRRASPAIHVRYRAHVTNPNESLWHPKAKTRRDDSVSATYRYGHDCGDRRSQHRRDSDMDVRVTAVMPIPGMWRRRESNPRPTVRSMCFYVRIQQLIIPADACWRGLSEMLNLY